jgi:L-fuconolactonase
VRIVDSHCHVSPLWYEPIESLLDQMDRHGVAQGVLIQILGQFDNSYQQACLRKYPGRFASVVGVDPGAADACDTLAALAEEGAVGVRLHPDARSPGADPLAIWRSAASAGLAVSCVGQARRFASPEFFELVGGLPELPIVLEHLGGTSRAGETDSEARRRVFEAARYPNVYLKVPGLGEIVARPARLPEHGPTIAERPGDLAEAIERFGPARLMWASDFPVVCSREGYANALAWTRDAVDADTRALIFGGTARRVFKLPEIPGDPE